MRSDAGAGAKGSQAEAGSSRADQAVVPATATSEVVAQPQRIDEALRLVHHHAGYVRVRAAAFLQAEADSPLLRSARTAAKTAPGFRSWAFNPRTGSVVIQYDPGTLEADDLLKRVARDAGFRGIEVATRTKVNRKELVSTFLDRVEDVNRVVSELTGDRADLRELVPAALLATSVVSFLVNDPSSRLPNWFSSLYRSYRVFMHWHRREVRTRERVARQADERASPEDRAVPS